MEGSQSMKRDDFYLETARALEVCQLVEQALKLYISEALALARKCIGDRMPFKMSGADYDDASLEKLIATFRKFSNNGELARKLEQFKKERNFISHRAITSCLDFFEEIDEGAALELRPRFATIRQAAEEILAEMRVESGALLPHLYLDDELASN